MSRIFSLAMRSIDILLRLFDAYCAAAGLAETTVSTRVFSDGKRIAVLRSGGDMGVRRLDRAFQWFSDHWPEGAEWPADIRRPSELTPEDRAA